MQKCLCRFTPEPSMISKPNSSMATLLRVLHFNLLQPSMKEVQEGLVVVVQVVAVAAVAAVAVAAVAAADAGGKATDGDVTVATHRLAQSGEER